MILLGRSWDSANGAGIVLFHEDPTRSANDWDKGVSVKNESDVPRWFVEPTQSTDSPKGPRFSFKWGRSKKKCGNFGPQESAESILGEIYATIPIVAMRGAALMHSRKAGIAKEEPILNLMERICSKSVQ